MQNDDFNIDVVIAEITAFAENMHAKNPVSYTHLTLPTKA